MKEHPSAAVGALIERDGKILLVRESGRKGPDAGKWHHPAGKIEIGEDPVTAIRREVNEETGYDFTPTGILGIYSIVRKDIEKQLGRLPHIVKLIFVGNISDQPSDQLHDDVTETKWFTPGEIEAMDAEMLRNIDTKQMVKAYDAGWRYPLNLLIHTIADPDVLSKEIV